MSFKNQGSEGHVLYIRRKFLSSPRRSLVNRDFPPLVIPPTARTPNEQVIMIRPFFIVLLTRYVGGIIQRNTSSEVDMSLLVGPEC